MLAIVRSLSNPATRESNGQERAVSRSPPEAGRRARRVSTDVSERTFGAAPDNESRLWRDEAKFPHPVQTSKIPKNPRVVIMRLLANVVKICNLHA